MKLPLLSGKPFRGSGLSKYTAKASHVKMKHPDGRVIVFPYHDEVDRYTLRGALRDADVDAEEFLKHV